MENAIFTYSFTKQVNLLAFVSELQQCHNIYTNLQILSKILIDITELTSFEKRMELV